MSANHHLMRRKGVYYYRRRVPQHLVAAIGSESIQCSLHTTSAAQAKKLRTLKDLECDAQFAKLAKKLANANASPAPATSQAPPLSEEELTTLVRDYVERMDERSRKRLGADPPESERQKNEMATDIEVGTQILRDRDDPRAHEFVYRTGEDILAPVGRSMSDGGLGADFAELVRRALLELDARSLSRLRDDHRRPFLDQLFNPARMPEVAFGELADQYLQVTKEEAAVNATSAKWVDKVTANLALIREIIGEKTPVHAIDYDACLRVRSMLGRIPANRGKIYNGVPLEKAIERAAIEKRPLLSSVTQGQYLATLRDVLDLAAKKRLIPVNFAEGMRPLKRDTVPASDKRRPFTLEQLRDFFQSEFYTECAKHPVPYAHGKPAWRFWLPLMCLFTGMRPNEAAQMLVDDLKQTKQGTWYLDIVATSDEGEDDLTPKTLKTATSRRKIPVHPELIAIGFLDFVEKRKKAGSGQRLFPDLKPDKYGNHASYALKRFRDTFLPKAIKLEPRQSFYSYRHNWRDLLRSIEAPPDTLQALGAWSQGKLTSDNYGDKCDPDYQVKYIKQIAFPGLDLSALHVELGTD